MPLSDLLLPEFDAEMNKTRVTLERIPEDKPEYRPHDKSMPMMKLANHTSEIPNYVPLILTTDEFDIAVRSSEKTADPSSLKERLERFDASVLAARGQLAAATDRAMHENWRLRAGDRILLSASRYHALRNVFFNHMIHHRAQLGLYLRLNDCPVPSIYGPSADEN